MSLARVDLMRRVPERLDGYATVLLAESGLTEMDSHAVAAVRSFLERGGRVVIACDAFYVNTGPKANEVLAGSGLQTQPIDVPGYTMVTNISADALTAGVRVLRFHRPCPIVVTDPSRAKLLAVDASGNAGHAAVARLPGGGTVVVLASSIWWNWLNEFKESSDNARFLQNVLHLGLAATHPAVPAEHRTLFRSDKESGNP